MNATTIFFTASRLPLRTLLCNGNLQQYSIKMNGIEKAAIQRALGTRSVIEDIDQLRILCGCSSVQVLTPIVETKLRSGTIPLKSLHVRLDLNDTMNSSRRTRHHHTVVDNHHLYDKSSDSSGVERSIDGDGIISDIFDIYLNIIYSIKQNNILINMKLDWKNMQCEILQELLDRYCQQISNKEDDQQVCKKYRNLIKKNNAVDDVNHDGDDDDDDNDINHNIGIELVSTVDVVKHIMQLIMELNGENDGNNKVNTTTDDSVRDNHKRSSTEFDIVDDDEDGIDQEVSDYIYTCRRCNQVLFTYNDLHEHSLDGAIQSSCTSYYLEDYPNWIVSTPVQPPSPSLPSSSLIDHLDHHPQFSRQPYCASSMEPSLKDKIHCIKCKSRIGSYSWSGSQCSCLEWVIPSFQFIKSKIDCKRAVNK